MSFRKKTYLYDQIFKGNQKLERSHYTSTVFWLKIHHLRERDRTDRLLVHKLVRFGRNRWYKIEFLQFRTESFFLCEMKERVKSEKK